MSRTMYQSGGLRWRNCVRAVRERLGLSQAELARRAGLKRQNLHKLETHQREPSVGTMLRLASALGVLVDDFIELEDLGPNEKWIWRCGDTRRVEPGSDGEQE